MKAPLLSVSTTRSAKPRLPEAGGGLTCVTLRVLDSPLLLQATLGRTWVTTPQLTMVAFLRDHRHLSPYESLDHQEVLLCFRVPFFRVSWD